ncbi:hypothetical protein FSARC_5719 [Fusarium sarcochroum]|uniref:Uncharacterized protein n=1 Tax=Fusarium sarcochroum TaxID=1208366 RepID=A0A8H4TZ04_9HYPO|nr:hypothetical protein FSARC_5719 [Fusarium sarcochroum]
MVVGAFLTGGLQLLFGSHKKAHPHFDDLNSTELEKIIPISSTRSTANTPEIPSPPRNVYSGLDRRHELRPQTSHFEPTSDQTELNAVDEAITPIETLRDRVILWAVKITGCLDMGVYGLLLMVGLPVYYITGCATPVQLGICVLSFQTAMRIPAKYRTYLYPILISATATVLIAWALAAIKGNTLQTALRQFRTGVTYKSLLLHPKNQSFPGAGDIIVAILDAGIVALALPKVFALAIPATENLGGDLSTVAAVAAMSGIIGALVSQRLLNYIRIPKEDHLTRGITLGANFAAIITALLLQTDLGWLPCLACQ